MRTPGWYHGQSLALVATSRAAAVEAGDREVEQQPGELLIGLAPVLGDGDKILIDYVDSRQFQGSQQVAMTFEAGESCRGPRQRSQVRRSEGLVAIDGEVLDPSHRHR